MYVDDRITQSLVITLLMNVQIYMQLNIFYESDDKVDNLVLLTLSQGKGRQTGNDRQFLVISLNFICLVSFSS